MIRYVNGDVRSQEFNAKHRVIPHCCNDQGLMGSGVAAALVSKWPEVREDYIKHYQSTGRLRLGSIIAVPIPTDDTCVVNMIAQHKTMVCRNEQGTAVAEDGWPPIRYVALMECMNRVNDLINKVHKGDAEIHCPKFGADLAGGEWNAIEGMIHEIWGEHNVTICVYE